MTQKVESWQGFEAILAGCGALSRHFGHLARTMSGEEKVALADKLVRTCVGSYEDEQAVVMLELMERAQKERFEKDAPAAQKALDEYLEELFWTLPSGCEHRHQDSKGTLVETKKHIFSQLIRQWRATELPETVYAFRRLIAMGWPERKDYRQRNGESDVEMKARGRHVSDAEREGLVAIMRNHIECFASYEEKKAGPNAVFGPWLAHACVPDEVRRSLAVARGRAGGPEMAVLDIRNAEILHGLPDSALTIIRATAERMRTIMVAGDKIFAAVISTVRARNRHYDAERYLDRALKFEGDDTVRIRIAGGDDEDQASPIFAAASHAVENLRGQPEYHGFVIMLEVYVGSRETPKTTLRQTWRDH